MNDPEGSESPLVLVLAGPNGAGKSTAASVLLPEGMTFVNADEVAKTLPGYPSRSVEIKAGRLVLEQMDGLEQRRVDFAVETTLAGRSLAARITRMQRLGYSFRLIFIWSPSADFSVHRVAERVEAGGHDIPEETIRRRFEAGLRNFFSTYQPLADTWEVHDNSRPGGPYPIAKGEHDRVVSVYDEERWKLMREGGGG